MERDLNMQNTSMQFGVSIHALVWSATNFLFHFQHFLLFQSPRSYGARLEGCAIRVCLCEFQSTRSYGARRRLIGICLELSVSIHALVWSATDGTEAVW